jgi:hypothetical protein
MVREHGEEDTSMFFGRTAIRDENGEDITRNRGRGEQ